MLKWTHIALNHYACFININLLACGRVGRLKGPIRGLGHACPQEYFSCLPRPNLLCFINTNIRWYSLSKDTWNTGCQLLPTLLPKSSTYTCEWRIFFTRNDPVHLADHLMDNSVGVPKFLQSNHIFSPTWNVISRRFLFTALAYLSCNLAIIALTFRMIICLRATHWAASSE